MFRLIILFFASSSALACPILDGEYICTSPDNQGSYQERIASFEVDGGRVYEVTMDYQGEIFTEVIQADGQLRAEPNGTSLAKCSGDQVTQEAESGEYDENDQKIAVIRVFSRWSQTADGYVFKGSTQFSFSDGNSLKYDSHWTCQKN